MGTQSRAISSLTSTQMRCHQSLRKRSLQNKCVKTILCEMDRQYVGSTVSRNLAYLNIRVVSPLIVSRDFGVLTSDTAELCMSTKVLKLKDRDTTHSSYIIQKRATMSVKDTSRRRISCTRWNGPWSTQEGRCPGLLINEQTRDFPFEQEVAAHYVFY